MSIESDLLKRANNKCELCNSTDELKAFELGPEKANSSDHYVLLCSECRDQIEGRKELSTNHWYCLNESMWSETPAVQVMAFRVLSKLKGETWASDLLDQLYLDDETRAWAESGVDDSEAAETKDSNGTLLSQGDSVTLIKDLVVKGANFTAKRGTTVKNISLTDDPKYIEGRVNGTHIVLVAAYLKKL